MSILNNQNSKVTIYVTSHNYSRFLKESIESVLNQTYKNWELFLIDDGSSDDSFEIMKSYESSTPKTMEAAIKKAVKHGLEGEERVMIGRHYGASDDFGRVHFVDMEVVKDASKDYDTRMRLVDPRTLQHLIVNNVKYNLK